jgi:hypothetical protein
VRRQATVDSSPKAKPKAKKKGKKGKKGRKGKKANMKREILGPPTRQVKVADLAGLGPHRAVAASTEGT